MSTAAKMQQAKTEATKSAQYTSQLAIQSQQIGSSEAQTEFADLRPQATTQRKLQDLASHSSQNRQLQAFQQMAKHSARATQLKTMGAMMNAPVLQREEDENPLQAKMEDSTVQREEAAAADTAEAPKPNNTGLPDNLKSGIESLSGMSMDHVKVHYNSAQPAQLNAHAYAQGSEIHVAPGQEQHLPHEAWHVVQQAQGRVRPTMQMKGEVQVNDDKGLEAEADVMGGRAQQLMATQNTRLDRPTQLQESENGKFGKVVQRIVKIMKKEYKVQSTMLKELRKYNQKKTVKRLRAGIADLVKLDVESSGTVPFDSIGEYYDNLNSRLPSETKEIKAKKPKFGEKGYVFKPQESGKMFNSMQGVEKFNLRDEKLFSFGHVALDREQKDQNACGTHNMAYNKDIPEISKEGLHTQMTEGQKAGSYISKTLLNEEEFKKEMTELQLVYGKDKKEKELLIMGGNSNEGNNSFKKYIGKNDSLDKFYKEEYSLGNKETYQSELELLYRTNEEFREFVDQGIESASDNKKRKRFSSGITDPNFRKKRKFRNSLKLKPTKNSSKTYGELEIKIPENKENKHSETNLLHYAKEHAIEVEQAIGSKVPCLSCFAAYCKEKNAEALLPSFGYLWFSESSIGQHVIKGLDKEEITPEDAEKFLTFIEACLKEYVYDEKNEVHMYRGNQGDININDIDDDSGSEGDEFMSDFIKKRKKKGRSKK